MDIQIFYSLYSKAVQIIIQLLFPSATKESNLIKTINTNCQIKILKMLFQPVL